MDDSMHLDWPTLSLAIPQGHHLGILATFSLRRTPMHWWPGSQQRCYRRHSCAEAGSKATSGQPAQMHAGLEVPELRALSVF